VSSCAAHIGSRKIDFDRFPAGEIARAVENWARMRLQFDCRARRRSSETKNAGCSNLASQFSGTREFGICASAETPQQRLFRGFEMAGRPRWRYPRRLMRKIVDYKFVSSESSDHVEKFIRSYLTDGWELFGAPSCSIDFYCQALVKYADEAASHSSETLSSSVSEP
jgi:hypothetical protein